MGKSRREYCVSPRVNEKSFGPMPMENSLTHTWLSFAVKKWPNSWMKMMR